MENHQLKRLINLSRKTGTPLIITDADGEESAVILSVDQFEELVGADEFNPETDLPEEFFASEPPLEAVTAPAEVPNQGFENQNEEPRFENDIDINKLAQQNALTDEEPGEERFYLEPIE